MKTTRIHIKNLFGISETELDGRSMEVTGSNGVGKTSIIDSIKYALTNDSSRDYVIKNGESEGEIFIETDTGLTIDRKKRVNQADYKNIRQDGKPVQSPEAFVRELFTPLQIDPIKFTQMSRQEQNRIILDLIEFDWDLNWIKEKFGEIPQGVDYQQNILQVLNDIQSEKGVYFQTRQDINREIRNKTAFISDIAKDIPQGFQAEKWEAYDLSEAYTKITKAQEYNSRIERAKLFKDSYDNKVRGYQAEMEIAVSNLKSAIAAEREQLTSEIERKKTEIKAAEDKLNSLSDKIADKTKIFESEYREKVAKLDSDIKVANEYIGKQLVDVSVMQTEVKTAEEMKKHLNEYRRMKSMQDELEALEEHSKALTSKIELARELPGEILKTATIPVKGLTVKDGIPLINGLPVSNLSEGEQLQLCVDVALSKPNSLQIILIDGAEKLSEKNRLALYEKCKEKGLQFIATRTTDSDDLEVTYL
ncbi:MULTISPECIES: AAA family ATPase [Ruminococcus]|uniref:AAA family ATPase n=1 Tax=Ruminococcus bicirculans (ex Wegman et al. 2014) TaxID=1160721 RepID=A0AAW6E6I2_9FIRM|nr:AAA family ATPase [Ruminococcus bicirculans (ex Wegman et al. 2014)]MDB8736920.1 AAA family ATPase [Ruminococcus bicirculans (ex Wegman et al. 2014)]MDB8742815.1 AAA family ATPase [Ruminococcus bicirculans (ex Wegman et al. 2014)]DAL91716.1 MAG TPA: STRUCTURAL MAINTENANCE OF CHROMOSOMES PROTEIN [Caudoviricetes sp.]